VESSDNYKKIGKLKQELSSYRALKISLLAALDKCRTEIRRRLITEADIVAGTLSSRSLLFELLLT
jgi:hypothetical protein